MGDPIEDAIDDMLQKTHYDLLKVHQDLVNRWTQTQNRYPDADPNDYDRLERLIMEAINFAADPHPDI